ncbi:CaiB/BaiF CoA transferase family protein [Corynebacterium liangguodongii]|uniref:Carnitine dehydratase n=1 Tax=Corynebacterium liangguodongii TaxID=2079535 RepID=A0A2S0WFA2_9CORY|nr:CoA transferase [Corynebacterium liangguodongii]AWB84448.1 carnitine dehydratase [Corynebacterium liangguodongii]PWB99937.1 CoA transferase [Corynebacterium liangguodongii]
MSHPPITTDTDGTRGPLSGIVVVDLSRVLAGPYCTMFLADLGATVIKIESPKGDDTRQWKPPAVDGKSTYFLSINRNKHSIALDLSKEEDLETAYALIDRADVLVENFKPGGLKKFGLDASQTAKRWPDLIHASITGFGKKGGEKLPGYDLLAQALSGFMHVTGEAEGHPQRAGFALFDVFTGLHAAVGVLAALYERGISGTGQSVEVNLLSSALSAMANQSAAYTAGGHEPMRMGNDHPSLFPYGPFKAADGNIVVCCGNDNQFRVFMDAIGATEVAEEDRYATMERRNANRDPLRTTIEQQLAAHTVSEWFDTLGAAGVCCAPILTVGGGVDYATKLGLDPVWDSGQPGDYPTVANPITLSATPALMRKPAPELDADAHAVKQWIRETNPRKDS